LLELERRARSGATDAATLLPGLDIHTDHGGERRH
jgi:hypothetical protein